MTEFAHVPVMIERTLSLLEPVPAGTYVDLTLGGAGHAEAVLDANPSLTLLGIDRDEDALAAAGPRLARFGSRVQLAHARSDQLVDVLAERSIHDVTAVLADLGVSSYQLDVAARGFSYREELDGPLDMRMDASSGITAATIVNEWSVGDIAAVLSDLGDERYSRRIAEALVADRPVTSTARLAELVKSAIPAPARRRGGNPAKRSFQALRIAVNDELGVLARTLDQAIEALVPGGRAVVIAYQSGEDRIVKASMRAADDGGCECPPGLPCGCGAVRVARLIKRGGWRPSPEEIAANRRAESAHMRAVEKLPTEPRPVR